MNLEPRSTFDIGPDDIRPSPTLNLLPDRPSTKRILWFSWKDKHHPLSGGAEVVADELMTRLVADGHHVTLLTGGYASASHTDTINGYNIIRVGGRVTVYWYAYRYYKKHLANKHFDIIIEEINTIPFFTKFYIKPTGRRSQACPAKRESNLSREVGVVRSKVDTNTVEGHMSSGLKVNTIHTQSPSEIAYSGQTFDQTRPSDLRLDSTLDLLPDGPSTFLLIHQLTRQIWFYEMVFPLSVVGYLLEPLYLRLLASRYGRRSQACPAKRESNLSREVGVIRSKVDTDTTTGMQMSSTSASTFDLRPDGLSTSREYDNYPKVITVSNSTRNNLIKYGFKRENISLITEGVHIPPVPDIHSIKKYERPTMFTIGRMVSMKRIPHIIRAFEYAKKKLPQLQLIIAGGNTSKYGQFITALASRSKYAYDIQVTGRVSEEEKQEIMRRSHVLAVTSVKEGWGLVVTEAGNMGTPAVVYDTDGLRDSVRNGTTGLITQHNTPRSLADSICELLDSQKSTQSKVKSPSGLKVDTNTIMQMSSTSASTLNLRSDDLRPYSPLTLDLQTLDQNGLSDHEEFSEYYKAIRKNAWEWNSTMTFDKQYLDFKRIIGLTPPIPKQKQ